MKPVILEATSKTPAVQFDAEKGLISLKGRSIPEHTVEFYKPLHNWIEEYGQNPQPKTNIELYIEYYNTSSSKSILDFLKRLEKIYKNGHDIKVNWYYEEEDESLFESGEEYKTMVDIPFETISVPIDSI
ncbi:MAG: DUF1987 domain-containing protein [Bacteroidota bacterium]